MDWDPTVLELGHAYFQLAQIPGLTPVVAEACQWLATHTATYDLVLVDLFTELHVPEAANDELFINNLCKSLNNSGMVMYNRIVLSQFEERNKQAWQYFSLAFPQAGRVRTHVNEVWHATRAEMSAR